MVLLQKLVVRMYNNDVVRNVRIIYYIELPRSYISTFADKKLLYDSVSK